MQLFNPSIEYGLDLAAVRQSYPKLIERPFCFSAYIPADYNPEIEALSHQLTFLFGGSSRSLIPSRSLIQRTWGQPIESEAISKINCFTDRLTLEKNLSAAIAHSCHTAKLCRQKSVAMEISRNSIMWEFPLV